MGGDADRAHRASAVVSVVMPALDEAAGIALAVEASVEQLDRLVADHVIGGFELLVVDDGSSDGTAAIVAKHAEADDRVRLLRHPRNRGLGAGIRTGLAAAQGDLLLYTDADMPIDLTALAVALPLLDDADLVAGRRTRNGGDGRFRSLVTQAYDRLAAVAFGVGIVDVNFPFKLGRVEDLRRLDLRCEGSLIDLELLAEARRTGLRVVSLPLEYQPRELGTSSTLTWRVMWPVVREAAGSIGRLRGRPVATPRARRPGSTRS